MEHALPLNRSRSEILAVDDRPDSLAAIQHTLRTAGYSRVRIASEMDVAITMVVQARPDLILLNLDARAFGGLEALTCVAAALDSREFVPLIALTSDLSQQKRRLAVSLGVNDFLRLPPDALELELRVRNLLEQRFLRLEKDAEAALQVDISPNERELLERLALIAEYRDDDTGLHTLRVGAWSAAIAQAIGYTPEDVEMMRLAAPLHDIGKIGIPDHVLLKVGPLTPAERNIMQSHTTIGADILKRSSSPVLQLARQIALCHHERWDGLGYPIGLKADQAPQAARIVAVVDTFDALTQKRPYKPAWAQEAALNEMRTHRGRQFDPEILDVLVALVENDSLREIEGRLSRTA
jgi:putative two-component system response regulator